MSGIVFALESHNIIGAAMAVHNTLGAGFTEKVYQDAFEAELKLQQIPYSREPELHIDYKGEILKSTFRPDFVCYDKIIVELKAIKELEEVHKAQAINYARICNFRLALLINFGETSLQQVRLPNFRYKR
ncbi:MAG: GxxExxY protein [Prevotella sp.]|nr:GxxExxY protein [Prevotella sp.]